MNPQQLENTALALLGWLVSNFGVQLVMSVFGILSGTTEGMIIEDVSAFVADILGAIRDHVTDDKIRALLDAEYNAADATVDIAEKAKFG